MFDSVQILNVAANSHLLICRQSWNWSSGGAGGSSRSLRFTFTGRIQSIVDENGVGAVREEAPFVWVQCVDTSLKSLWLFGSCVHSRFFSAGIRPAELDESVLLSDWTPCLFFFFYSHCLSVLAFECARVFVYLFSSPSGRGVGGARQGRSDDGFVLLASSLLCVCVLLHLFLSFFFTFFFFFRGPALGQAGPFGSILAPSHGWWLMALKKTPTNTFQKDSSTRRTYLIFAHQHVSVHKQSITSKNTCSCGLTFFFFLLSTPTKDRKNSRLHTHTYTHEHAHTPQSHIPRSN